LPTLSALTCAASDNTVGGNTVALRNIIAGGPGGTGVAIQPSAGASNNLIQETIITPPHGTKAFGFSTGVSEQRSDKYPRRRINTGWHAARKRISGSRVPAWVSPEP
jgi:hypothetical protein